MNPEHDEPAHWDHDQASSGWGWYERNGCAMTASEREDFERNESLKFKNFADFQQPAGGAK